MKSFRKLFTTKKMIAINMICIACIAFVALIRSAPDKKSDTTLAGSMATKIIDAVNRGDASAISDLETDHFREKAGGNEVASRLGELGREYGRIDSPTRVSLNRPYSLLQNHRTKR